MKNDLTYYTVNIALLLEKGTIHTARFVDAEVTCVHNIITIKFPSGKTFEMKVTEK